MQQLSNHRVFKQSPSRYKKKKKVGKKILRKTPDALFAPSPAFRSASSSYFSPSSRSAVDACVNMKDSRRSDRRGRPPFLPCRATNSARQFWLAREKTNKKHHQQE